ncbi:hypothetical protein PSHT_05161 [Puccinia striiformis]|uniref:Aldoketomutase n=1 Tax=Puccinia striiformis TaxID=27350 RepID=A0A2S4WB92_9BASI|nr:hypothetical protein PSHT_05161 [Puccinia striiformis]
MIFASAGGAGYCDVIIPICVGVSRSLKHEQPFPHPTIRYGTVAHRFSADLQAQDPKISLEFYQDVLGMQLLHKMEFEPAKFTNYFLGFPVSDQDSKSAGPLRREGVLELCHNWGTESDDSFSGYHNGNKSPQGFGHLAITCDDIEKTCAYFEEKQVKFQKNLNDGQLKGIAFIQDPDGYWIEILANNFFDK